MRQHTKPAPVISRRTTAGISRRRVSLSGGVSVVATSKYLGHSDAAVTLRVDTKIMPEDRSAAVAVMDAEAEKLNG